MIGLVVVCVAVVVAIAAVVTPTMDFSAAVPLDVVARTAQTGDLILFRANDGNALVRLYTPFTHVGMVVVETHGGKKTYVLETHRRGDVNPSDIVGGVQMYDLAERISRYDGRVCYARLKRPLTDGQRLAMLDLAYRYRNVPYHEAYVRHYVSHCMLGIGPGKTDETMFCSEFIGLLFRHVGMYDGDTQCLAPVDVAVGHERPVVVVVDHYYS